MGGYNSIYKFLKKIKFEGEYINGGKNGKEKYYDYFNVFFF